MIDDRPPLPQLEHRPFLTDSGLETTLIFIDGIDLPEFAAFPLLETSDGRRRLRHYFERHASIAREAGCGFIAEAPTWRANPHWGGALGYDREELDSINKHAITLLADLRDRDGRGDEEYVISGCIGPRGDGYDPSSQVSAEDAERYHAQQIESFADTHADLVSAMTLTHVEEAIGVTWAAQAIGIPAVISFTLETDGRLPSGTTLGDAIEEVDEATDCGPRVLHGQLRPPHALRARPRRRRVVARAAARDPRKRLVQEPRRARRGDRARLRRPRGPGIAVRLAGREVSAADDPRRLLRNRRAPRRGDRTHLRRLRVAAQRLDLGSPGAPMRLTRQRWIFAPIPTPPTVGDRGAHHKQGESG